VATDRPLLPAIVESTLAISRLFEQLGVRHLVGGSVASSLMGLPRTTQDVDFVADLELSNVAEFVALASRSFYVDEERARHAVARRSQFNLIDVGRGFKVDVYLDRRDRLSASTYLRSQLVQLGPMDSDCVRVSAPEDIVIEKLRWYRMGGEVSERQWLDVLGVLKVQAPTIDRAYLRHWADEIGVRDLLDRAFEDAGYT
jgi:hypothetical protein